VTAGLLGAALLLLAATPAAAQIIRLHTGVSLSTGSYLFTERTTTWAFSSGLSVRSGAFTVRAGLPVYWQNTTLVAGSSAGHIPTGGSSSRTVADSGGGHRGGGRDVGRAMASSHARVDVPGSAATGYRGAVGDPDLALRWQGVRTRSVGLAIGAAVKVPLADTATFGTGEWDLGAQVSVDRSLGERAWAALDLAYWKLGDLPDLELRDPVSGTLSVSRLGLAGWGWSVLGHAATPIVDGFDGSASIGASLTRISSGRSGWTLMTLLGLTETTPDLTVGLSWSLRLRD
jgi:hypothetical protein